MIKVQKVNKQYAGKFVANDINVNFEKGKVTSIIGPNGAGKSYLTN